MNASDRGHIYLVDDDDRVRKAISRSLTCAGFLVESFSCSKDALDAVSRTPKEVDAILSDLVMPGSDGMELLAGIKDRFPFLPVVMMTGHGSASSAVKAMKLGAYDYLEKPFSTQDAPIIALDRAIEAKRHQERRTLLTGGADSKASGIVGSSPRMAEVFRVVENVASVCATVLIRGESGSGKELVARTIHARSKRRKHPFVAVNCAALAESLLESELFGHEKGAFTGAISSRPGIFEQAEGGTIFLDEIGDVSPAMQVRLLRVLQEGEVKPVGSNDVRKVDARIIAATHRDLGQRVREGLFREDLYYRLNVLPIEIPPLRDRPEDLPLLINFFLDKYTERHSRSIEGVDDGAFRLLLEHNWPGNVRELENVIQRAVILADDRRISTESMARILQRAVRAEKVDEADAVAYRVARAAALDSFDRQFLKTTLERARGNVAHAANAAGLDRANFRRLARKLGVDVSLFRSSRDNLSATALKSPKPTP